MLFDNLDQFEQKYYALEQQMADPDIISDIDRLTKINQEYKELKEIVEKIAEYKELKARLQEASEMMSDPEMKEMAQEEYDLLNEEIPRVEESLKMLLIPKDKEDSRNVIFEIRSGTGGDEASLFAGDLYSMYTKYFEAKGWRTEIVSVNEGTVGGYNKVTLEISGENVYGTLKFESGAHRVQRVPKTESQGRVHTSAATVAVIPKLEMEDVDIKKTDLKVDTFRSSGAGGQHVNKTESGVRFTHIPTGIVAESTDGRSQIKNREIALQRLYQKVVDVRREKYEREQASKRKSLVGSGDRSDKIRTYNFPQNRLTDHRINLTLYSLDKVMGGEIDEILEALRIYENTEKLKEIEQGY